MLAIILACRVPIRSVKSRHLEHFTVKALWEGPGRMHVADIIDLIPFLPHEIDDSLADHWIEERAVARDADNDIKPVLGSGDKIAGYDVILVAYKADDAARICDDIRDRLLLLPIRIGADQFMNSRYLSRLFQDSLKYRLPR